MILSFKKFFFLFEEVASIVIVIFFKKKNSTLRKFVHPASSDFHHMVTILKRENGPTDWLESSLERTYVFTSPEYY